AGEGGNSPAGIGGAHGTWRRSRANHSRNSGRKRTARHYWWSAGRWLSLCGRPLSRRDRAIESASLKRNCDRCANAGVHFYSFGALRFVIWIDSGFEICRTAQHFIPPKRRTDDQREPGAASGAEFAGGWSGCDGARAFDERWRDDFYLC